MLIDISTIDAQGIGLGYVMKERIINFVHEHLGLASVVRVKIVHDPFGISLETAAGKVIADRTLTRLLEVVKKNAPLV